MGRHSKRPSARVLAARNSVTVAGWTLVSRITGLVRLAAIGATLGPTYFANTFATTNTLPNTVYSAIAGQALALVIVPAVVRAIARAGVGEAGVLLGRVAGFLLVASGTIALLVMVGALGFAWVLTLGIEDVVSRQQAQHATVVLVLLVAPQIVLYTIAALGAAAQQAQRRFALASAAPAVENVVLVATLVAVSAVYGTGHEVGAVPAGLLLLLGVGSTLAVAVHAALQVWGAARVGLLVRPSFRWRSDPEAMEVVRQLRGSISIPVAPAAAHMVLLLLAATVPGGVVVLQLAYAVYVAPTALGARAVSTVVLPGMSAAAQSGDRTGFAAQWRLALSYAAIAGLPPLCLLAVFARPVAEVLAVGELQAESFVDQLAACVTVVAVAQLVAGLHEIGRQALFARKEIGTPRVASLVSLAVTVLVGSSSLLVDDAGRLVVLSAALLAGDLVAAGTVITRLRAVLTPEPLADRRRIAVAIAAAVAMLPVAWAGWWALRVIGVDGPGDLGLLAGCALLALATYGIALHTGARTMVGRAR